MPEAHAKNDCTSSREKKKGLGAAFCNFLCKIIRDPRVFKAYFDLNFCHNFLGTWPWPLVMVWSVASSATPLVLYEPVLY